MKEKIAALIVVLSIVVFAAPAPVFASDDKPGKNKSQGKSGKSKDRDDANKKSGKWKDRDDSDKKSGKWKDRDDSGPWKDQDNWNGKHARKKSKGKKDTHGYKNYGQYRRTQVGNRR